MKEDEIKKLQSVIDELRIESRKLEYSSALNRLIKRVDEVERKLEIVIEYIKCQKKE